MKKPKPRYTDRREILADIYSAERKARTLLASAAELEKLSKEQLRGETALLIMLGIENQLKAEKLRASATRILETKLPRFGEKLAEISTMALPGIIEDNSVEAL